LKPDRFKPIPNIACLGSKGYTENAFAIAKENMRIAVSRAKLLQLASIILVVVQKTYANVGVLTLHWRDIEREFLFLRTMCH